MNELYSLARLASQVLFISTTTTATFETCSQKFMHIETPLPQVQNNPTTTEAYLQQSYD